MSTPRAPRRTRLGLVLLAAALGLSVLAFFFGDLWAAVLAVFSVPPRAADAFHTLWIPLSGLLLNGAIASLGVLSFALLWRGRGEIGGAYASGLGLALLMVLIAAAAYVLFGLTGLFLGYVAGVAFLAPWHGLLAILGGIFVGLGLYVAFSNLPLAGSRPVAAVAFALGVAGLVLLDLTALGFRRIRLAGIEGAGLGFALASVILWLVLCLWAAETLRGSRSPGVAPASSNG